MPELKLMKCKSDLDEIPGRGLLHVGFSYVTYTMRLDLFLRFT
jgi:hypothetical protein